MWNSIEQELCYLFAIYIVEGEGDEGRNQLDVQLFVCDLSNSVGQGDRGFFYKHRPRRKKLHDYTC
jgi:hypothetical protein